MGKDIYEREVLAVIHEEGLTELELQELFEKEGMDDIDKLLESSNFDYSYRPEGVEDSYRFSGTFARIDEEECEDEDGNERDNTEKTGLSVISEKENEKE